jgi:lipopolysaccharide export system permease protein
MSFRPARIFSLGRIERYVLVEQARALVVALAIIASLIMLIDFVEISRGVGSDVDLSAVRILGLMAMKSPAVILQLMPFVFLFGTLAAYVGLNRRSELIAMRAAGLSAWRFVLPAAGTALVFGVLTVAAFGPAAAWGDGLFQRERTRLSSAPVETDAPKAVWIREGNSERQMILRAERQDTARATLQGVTVFIYTVGDKGALDFVERIDAASAALTAGSWRLTDAVGAQTGQRAVSYARLDLPSSLARDEAFARFARPQSTSLWALPTQIKRVEQAGFSSTAYRLRLHQLLATPLMFAAMSILAAAFSLRLMRLGDLAKMSIAAVILGFAFFFVNQTFAAFGAAEVIPPFLAAWLPPVLTGLAAFTLLFYTEDG